MNGFLTFLKAVITGILTGLIVSIPLGPAGIESIKRTITIGFKKGFTVSIGALSADVTYMLLINCGLSNLLSANKKTEALFWIISGAILSLIGYSSIRKGEHVKSRNLKNQNLNSFFSGYFIVLTNPMTLSLWLTVSGTSIKAWQMVGRFYYITYMSSIVAGMVLWFAMLNFFAYKGIKFFSPSNTEKTSFLLKYLILGIGFAFILFGFVMFIRSLFLGG